MNTLKNYGWTKKLDEIWINQSTHDTQPGRVVADFGTSLKIAIPEIITAELSGKLAHYTVSDAVPKVGDWVSVQVSDSGHAVISGILPRQSEIVRKVAGGRTKKQIIAANVDIAFVLLALDNDFNVERLRRFLYQLSINAIQPIVVLNKADKTTDLDSYTSQLQSFDLPIITAIATDGVGVEQVLAYIEPGKTAVLLGSSGVGKSTLTNQLLGRDVQKTQAIRESDDSGKHTTVHRELFVLPGGGLLIDMPGIREFQLWGTEEDLEEDFGDILYLTRQCKYSSCQHGSDDGCMIQAALKNGSLDRSRYAAFIKMKKELGGLKDRNIEVLKRANGKSKQIQKKHARDSKRDIRQQLDE